MASWSRYTALKAAIICHAGDQWTETLRLVLLGIRSAYKEDLNASAAKLVYGERLLIPGEFVMPTTRKVDPQPFTQRLYRALTICVQPRHTTLNAGFIHT